MTDDPDKTVFKPIDELPRTRQGSPNQSTIIRPTPGTLPPRGTESDGRDGLRGFPAPPYEPRPENYAGESQTSFESIASFGGSRNRLIEAGAKLFALVGQLSNFAQVPDPAEFHTRVKDEMTRFRTELDQLPLSAETRHQASFALCTLVDTCVLNSPLGFSQSSDSVWTHSNLLSLFHGRVDGGKDFFSILEAAKRSPGPNVELLEFLYVALSLGLRGQYGIREGGADSLLDQRHETYRLIRSVRGNMEPTLSPKWEGLPPIRGRIVEYVPLWVVAAVAALLLASLYAVFWVTLSDRTDPVLVNLETIDEKPVQLAGVGWAPRLERPSVTPRSKQPPREKPMPVPPRVDLRGLLADDVSAGNIEIIDAGDRLTIRFLRDGLFGSGKTAVRDSFHPLLMRIGDALNRVNGRILVVGHTDNVKPRVGQPSNRVLSLKRAKSVKGVLAAYINPPERIETNGKGDTVPLVPNTTAANRAKNRRVEISIVESTTR